MDWGNSMTISLVGRRFGHLEVLAPAGRPGNVRGNGTYWSCRCACQSVIVVSTSRLMASSHRPTSCGCLDGSVAHARPAARTAPLGAAPTQAPFVDTGARADLRQQVQLLIAGSRRVSAIARLLIDAIAAGDRLTESALMSVAEELESLDQERADVEQALTAAL
jgi:hypothetical protein